MKTKLLLMLLCMSFSIISFGQDCSKFWKKSDWIHLEAKDTQLTTPEDSPTDGRISLRLAGNGSYMTILIGFIPEGTVNFDDGFDGHFINDGAAIEFYSFIESTRLSIQALPELINTNVQVPLGYEITSDGTYTISIDAEFLDPTFDIILEDTYEGINTDLRQVSYSFSGTIGEVHDRFFLNLNKRQALNVEDIPKMEDTTYAYFTSNILTIHSKQANFKTVELFNMAGKHIFTTDFTNKITVNSLARGIYILRCTDTSGAIITKKIVK